MKRYLDVVFDGPPSHDGGRFVEVEDQTGRSVEAGEWLRHTRNPGGTRLGAYSVLRIPVSDESRDVADFHARFGMIVADRPQHLTQRKLKERILLLLEEVSEFADACGFEVQYDVECVEGKAQDFAAQQDALQDVVYVAKGTAAMQGAPWKDLWDDVHACNMAKVPGETHRGNASDVTKPPGWTPPQTLAILVAHGYDPADPGPEVDDPGVVVAREGGF